MTSFEDVLEACRSLPTPGDDGHRIVEWISTAPVIGVARQPSTAIEVFIKGARLSTRSETVARHLRHDSWMSQGGSRFAANRVVLPSDDHFIPVAALIVEELLRAGLDGSGSIQSSFEIAEPIIEMALRGSTLGDEFQLGLLGELYFLRFLLQRAGSKRAQARCLHAWRGHERASRDFVFPHGVEIEVKVTRRTESVHAISRLSQVDPYRTSTGIPIERLYLLSLGVVPAEGDGASIPELVEDVLVLLQTAGGSQARNAIQELFLNLVANYGGPSAGYSHGAMGDWDVYGRQWRMAWERVYDMNDEGLSLLRMPDVERFRHIEPASVGLTVRLPTEPVSPGNPAAGLKSLLQPLAAQLS